MAIKYGGKTTPDYSAMRGPCPEGFHIPSKNERSSLGEILITTFSMAESSTTAGTYLKMPLSGTISSMDGSSGNRGSSDTRYRSSSCYDYDSQNYIAYSVRMFSGYINFNESTNRSGGLAIRPFKDIPLIPDSNWTTLYDGSSVATGAGIFHNPTLGLISISGNGNTWITIADKNLGATTVYNQGDSTKDSNCGKYFQRGNNYGFTYGDTLTTSSTQIDASSYGPGNYYSSSTFILGGYFSSWDSSNNMNLRGGVTGVQQKPVDIIKKYYGGKLINDYSAMRGPAPKGYHLPTAGEINYLVTVLTSTFSLPANSATVGTYLKMPEAGCISTPPNILSGGRYRSCKNNSTTGGRSIYFTSSSLQVSSFSKGLGCTIRAFKDVPVIPDSNWTTLYDGSSVATGAGIFHNTSLGLISISANGQNWYTIADKNLGATTVYNQGDTLSESNCGKFYQRGNNYGFPRGGTVTTSSTTVDASDYGPGNYYSSSTFIISGTDRSSVTNNDLRGGETGIQQRIPEVIKVYYNTTKIRERTIPALCFTAEQASSSVTLSKVGSPTSVNLETSTDGSTWSDYTFGTAISLASIGDKVYFRNKSDTVTLFSTSTSNRYTFSISGMVGCSGDIGYLLCKNSTDTLPNSHCFCRLFYSCTGLTTAPELPATTIMQYCYYQMFYGCTNLTTVNKLPATTLPTYCYYRMYYNCSKIKLSSSQTGDYTQPYRIPIEGTGSTSSNALNTMFTNTGGSWAGTPSVNTTYYLHKDNTIV